MTGSPTRLRFTFDFACPYAFLAALQVDALAARGVDVRWDPVLVGGLFRAIGAPDSPSLARAAARNEMERAGRARIAALSGVSLVGQPSRSVRALRLVLVAPPAQRGPLVMALFRAAWLRGADLSDRALLERIGRVHGADASRVDSVDVKAALRANTSAAQARGEFGVPVCAVGDDWWFGQDRVYRAVAALSAHPARPPMGPAGRPGGRMELFHDFASPFSYIAAMTLPDRAAAAGVRLDMSPILLGALFRQIGTPDVPLMAMGAARRAWTERDLFAQAEEHGVTLRFPSVFPVRSVLPLRVSLLEPRAIPAFYTALWAQDRDIGQPAVVSEVLMDAGLDGGLIDAASAPEVKAALRRNTDAAVEAGVCGVPTVRVNGRRLHWGVDRLHVAFADLAGQLAPEIP